MFWKAWRVFYSLFLITPKFCFLCKCFSFSSQLPSSCLKGVFKDLTIFNQQNEKAIRCQEAILTSYGSLKRVAPVKRVRVLVVVAHAQPIVNRVTFLISRICSARLETSVHRRPWVEVSDRGQEEQMYYLDFSVRWFRIVSNWCPWSFGIRQEGIYFSKSGCSFVIATGAGEDRLLDLDLSTGLKPPTGFFFFCLSLSLSPFKVLANWCPIRDIREGTKTRVLL